MGDFSSLNNFNNVNFGNDNAIVNLNQDNKLTSNSTFSKANIFRFIRSSTTRANNNHVRTEFLKSLGKAFGIEQGIGAGPKGEVTFSKDFMDKLEKILGPAFRREDFGVPAEGGEVKSGKPLTQRRIKQIMTEASIFDSDKFSVEGYKNKLALIMKENNIPDTTKMNFEEFKNTFNSENNPEMKNNPLIKVFASIQQSLQFLENLDSYLINNRRYELELADVEKKNPGNKEARKEVVTNTDKKFEIKNLDTGKYEILDADKLLNLSNEIFKLTGGNLIHTESTNFSLKNSESIDSLKKYIADTIIAYVKNGIDCYFDAKAQGKEESFKKHCTSNLGACMEDKGKHFIQFRQSKLVSQGPVDTSLNAELEAVVNREAAKSQKEMIVAELTLLMHKNPNGEWKDFASEIKSKLVGKSSNVIVFSKREENNVTIRRFDELEENGKPVVRKITEEDIDRLGPEIMKEIEGENDEAMLDE